MTRRFADVLNNDAKARAAFDILSPYRQKTILKYLASLNLSGDRTKRRGYDAETSKPVTVAGAQKI